MEKKYGALFPAGRKTALGRLKRKPGVGCRGGRPQGEEREITEPGTFAPKKKNSPKQKKHPKKQKR